MASIYIVEDDDNIQELYTLFLTRMGHTIVGQSFNGEEALIDLLCNFNHKKPDILILDYHMPIKNGIELLEDLYESDWMNKTKVLFISSIDFSEIKIYERPLVRYINKPVKFKILEQLISEVINVDQRAVIQET